MMLSQLVSECEQYDVMRVLMMLCLSATSGCSSQANEIVRNLFTSSSILQRLS